MFPYPMIKECAHGTQLRCITPNQGGIIHRFFDTSPISPSGRYMALCRLPYEDRNAIAGDVAQIVLCDLETGEERVVYHTHGWESQVGANVQWGVTDETLVFNDVIPGQWTPFMVVLNPFTGCYRCMGNGVFMLSPDGTKALTHNLNNSRITQYGYGVTVPDAYLQYNVACSSEDGFYQTDLVTGETHLFLSLKQLLTAVYDSKSLSEFGYGAFYGFQCKWNQQQTRILMVVRCYYPDTGKRKAMIFTANTDGSNIKLALPWQAWSKSGHHVNWHPDGEHLTMNLRLDEPVLRFVQFRYDGEEFHALSNKLIGSGHPSIHQNGRFMITDTYTSEHHFFRDGTVPIRLIDLQTEKETELARIYTKCDLHGDLRIDPHPAWSRDYSRIVFNGFTGNTRRVYMLDHWENAICNLT